MTLSLVSRRAMLCLFILAALTTASGAASVETEIGPLTVTKFSLEIVQRRIGRGVVNYCYPGSVVYFSPDFALTLAVTRTGGIFLSRGMALEFVSSETDRRFIRHAATQRRHVDAATIGNLANWKTPHGLNIDATKREVMEALGKPSAVLASTSNIVLVYTNKKYYNRYTFNRNGQLSEILLGIEADSNLRY